MANPGLSAGEGAKHSDKKPVGKVGPATSLARQDPALHSALCYLLPETSPMPIRTTCLCLALLLFSMGGHASDKTEPYTHIFNELASVKNELARYQYLVKVMPTLPPREQSAAAQLLAWTENELGLYNEAIVDFPLVPRMLPRLDLPQPADWKAAQAADAIASMAAGRRIVLINEAHHDAHTRQLVLALLPRLRALGFDHFAAEALGEKDPELVHRGYPVPASGSEYLREPLYGEIIRTAIQLGFVITPYDSDEQDPKDREKAQAENLYQRVFVGNPGARLFVLAGFAHIDKAKGRLGKAMPMAMHLEALTGIEPLSIDQVQFRDIDSRNELDAYHQLIARFQPKLPTVLLSRTNGKAWSASPKQYDVSVILPADTGFASVKNLGSAWMTLGMEGIRIKEPVGALSRPDWLDLDGQRQPYPITSDLCAETLPCMVEARYIHESASAIPADRYAFFKPDAKARLYLRPGKYALSASTAEGTTLSMETIVVSAPPGKPSHAAEAH